MWREWRLACPRRLRHRR